MNLMMILSFDEAVVFMGWHRTFLPQRLWSAVQTVCLYSWQRPLQSKCPVSCPDPACCTEAVLSKLWSIISALLTWNQRVPPHSSPIYSGRAAESHFTLVGAHQCGVLMDVLDDLLSLYPLPIQAPDLNQSKQGGYHLHSGSRLKEVLDSYGLTLFRCNSLV